MRRLGVKVLRFPFRLLWPKATNRGMFASIFVIGGIQNVVYAVWGFDSIAGLVAYTAGGFWLLILLLRFATSPIPGARPAFAAAAAIFALVGVLPELGVQVQTEQIAQFYSTVAQVDAALLIVLALDVTWAPSADRRRWLSLITTLYITASLGAALVALGRGADTGTLFQVAMTGLALGLLTILLVARERFWPSEPPTQPEPPEVPREPPPITTTSAPVRRQLAVAAVVGWTGARLLTRLSRR